MMKNCHTMKAQRHQLGPTIPIRSHASSKGIHDDYMNPSNIWSCFYFRWYFGKIKRVEAEKKLLSPDNEHGAYLIRDSESRRNDYSLSGTLASSIHYLELEFDYRSSVLRHLLWMPDKGVVAFSIVEYYTCHFAGSYFLPQKVLNLEARAKLSDYSWVMLNDYFSRIGTSCSAWNM